MAAVSVYLQDASFVVLQIEIGYLSECDEPIAEAPVSSVQFTRTVVADDNC